jgi:prephenate dehydrogenase
MGKRCAKLFSDGFLVDIVSRRDVRAEAHERGAQQSADARKSISEADFIFLAVPIEALDIWIPKINEFARPECVVMDCCTVRQAANERLSQVLRKRFGMPEVGGQHVLVDGEPDERISEYLLKHGCQVFQMKTDKSHGKPVVGLAHFIGMALDLKLTETDRSVMSQSPACCYLLQLIEHLKSNSPSTYKETQLLNPYMSERRKELIDWLKEFDTDLDKGIFRFESYPRDRWRE